VALRPDNALTPEEKRARAQSAQEDVLLREVDDAVRQDQYAEAAEKYAKPAIVLVVLVLAAFGGFLFWQNRQDAANEADSEKLVAALDDVQRGDLAGGAAALDPLIADGNAAARASAQLLKAGIAMEQSKPAEAAALFDKVAADGDAPQALRDIALIRAVTTRYDTTPPADVVAKLKPLAVPGNPFFAPAGELVAMAYLDQGKQAEAGALFAAISRDKNTSDSTKGRVRQMAGLLGVDAIDDVDTVIGQPDAQLAGPAAAPAE
jgi:hypothetical protein